MAQLIKPGLMFQAAPLPTPPEGLAPTMSTYQYGWNLEGCPRTDATYVVCQDWSIQDVHEPSRPIGWELLEDENGWSYRVTQMNHKPKPLAVFFRGNADPVPAGSGKIGSVVMVCRRVEEPQNAEVIEQSDDGEEVSSTPRGGSVCPGAPLKALYDHIAEFKEAVNKVTPETVAADPKLSKISSIDPLLAACAVIVDDPAQTDAMARFADGKMSYAEMRMLCG